MESQPAVAHSNPPSNAGQQVSETATPKVKRWWQSAMALLPVSVLVALFASLAAWTSAVASTRSANTAATQAEIARHQLQVATANLETARQAANAAQRSAENSTKQARFGEEMANIARENLSVSQESFRITLAQLEERRRELQMRVDELKRAEDRLQPKLRVEVDVLTEADAPKQFKTIAADGGLIAVRLINGSIPLHISQVQIRGNPPTHVKDAITLPKSDDLADLYPSRIELDANTFAVKRPGTSEYDLTVNGVPHSSSILLQTQYGEPSSSWSVWLGKSLPALLPSHMDMVLYSHVKDLKEVGVTEDIIRSVRALEVELGDGTSIDLPPDGFIDTLLVAVVGKTRMELAQERQANRAVERFRGYMERLKSGDDQIPPVELTVHEIEAKVRNQK